MTTTSVKMVAILGGRQGAVRTVADQSPVKGRAEIVVFGDHVDGENCTIERLRD